MQNVMGSLAFERDDTRAKNVDESAIISEEHTWTF